MKYSKSTNIFLVLIFLLASLVGCISKSDKIKGDKLLDFDISPNGKSIVFSWLHESGYSTIYQTNIDDFKPRELVNANDSLSSYLPRYSNSGDKIVFIRRKPETKEKTSIWILDTSGLKQFTNNNSLIVEAVFSFDDQNLYYSKANEYDSYSPFASKAAHGFDIYLFDLSLEKSTKMSNVNAYSLYDFTDLNNDEMLITLTDKIDGVFIYKKNENVYEKILASSDTINNFSMYSSPVVVDPNTIICSSSYELVSFNRKNKTEKRILSSTGRHFKIIRFSKKQGKIYFQKRDNSNSIFSVNIDGSDLKEIPIYIDSNIRNVSN